MWLMAYNVAVIGKQSHWACRGVKSFFLSQGLDLLFFPAPVAVQLNVFNFLSFKFKVG